MDQKFSLKWNDFQTNISRSFSKLRAQRDFYDVTLVSDDQQQIAAHKLVLSACSGYFEKLLRQHNSSNLLLCLEGVSYAELENVLDYIYLGEVQINQDKMDRFLYVAQRFQLDGLLLMNTDQPCEAIKEESNTTYLMQTQKLDFIDKPRNKNEVVEESNRNFMMQSKNLDYIGEVIEPENIKKNIEEPNTNDLMENRILDLKEEVTGAKIQNNKRSSKKTKRKQKPMSLSENPMFTVVNTSTETTREFTYYANIPNISN